MSKHKCISDGVYTMKDSRPGAFTSLRDFVFKHTNTLDFFLGRIRGLRHVKGHICYNSVA